LTINDIESNVNLLQTKLITAHKTACPLRTVKSGWNAPYWSSDQAKLCKVARRAWNRRTRNPDDYALRGAQRVSFKKFTNEVDGVKLTARLQTILS
jgi:hypothetical protein